MQTKPIASIYSILEKIAYIEDNITLHGSIHAALQDAKTTRPAILMFLTGIAEQFTRLKQKEAKEILSFFDAEELKGIQDIRNFIAHDYDGVELSIIEWMLRYALPDLKEKCHKALQELT